MAALARGISTPMVAATLGIVVAGCATNGNGSSGHSGATRGGASCVALLKFHHHV